MMIFKVTKQFSGGREQPCHQFKTLALAKEHAATSAADNARMKINVIYRVYEFDDLIETIDSSKVDLTDTSEESSSSGSSHGASGKPTPFATAPLPKGAPPKWMSTPPDEDDDQDKDK